jgi:geranylgeranyl diphosphate synthase type I
MRDDVLGAFGDEDRTGKPVGDDLREGKPTPLLARARAAATSGQLAVLDRIGRPDLTDEHVAEIQDVIIATGALAELESTIVRLTDRAIRAIGSVELAGGAVDELVALAEFVSQREV